MIHQSGIFNILRIACSVLILYISLNLNNFSDAQMRYGYDHNKNYISHALHNHSVTVIFINGLKNSEVDDDEEYWGIMFTRIQKPYMKVICPSLKNVLPSLKDKKKLPYWTDRKFSNHSSMPEDAEGLVKGAEYIHKLIDAEVEQGISPKNIVVGGYDQGGAIALHAGLTYGKVLGGIMGMCTWLPFRKLTISQYWNPVNKQIPILISHRVLNKTNPNLYDYDTKNRLMDVTDDLKFDIHLFQLQHEGEFQAMRDFLWGHYDETYNRQKSLKII